jgi:hypothetical protein
MLEDVPPSAGPEGLKQESEPRMSSLAPPRNGSLGSITNGSPGPSSSTKDLLNAALQTRVSTNNYITHLKIWESANEGPPQAGSSASRKARYLILAVQRDSGVVTLNKAKRNANGSFSIGKDWDLNTLREIEVHSVRKSSFCLIRA